FRRQRWSQSDASYFQSASGSPSRVKTGSPDERQALPPGAGHVRLEFKQTPTVQFLQPRQLARLRDAFQPEGQLPTRPHVQFVFAFDNPRDIKAPRAQPLFVTQAR